MTKKKKLIISCIAVFCALAIALGSFFGIRACKNQPHFTVKDTLPDGQGKKQRSFYLVDNPTRQVAAATIICNKTFPPSSTKNTKMATITYISTISYPTQPNPTNSLNAR